MYQVIYQEENKIEILLKNAITKDEFKQVIHQLESLCTMYDNINVLFNATEIIKYDFTIVLDEYDFYKKYRQYLARLAIVTDLKAESFFVKIFNKFSDAEIKIFKVEDIEEARKWIFPSKLP